MPVRYEMFARILPLRNYKEYFSDKFEITFKMPWIDMSCPFYLMSNLDCTTEGKFILTQINHEKFVFIETYKSLSTVLEATLPNDLTGNKEITWRTLSPISDPSIQPNLSYVSFKLKFWLYLVGYGSMGSNVTHKLDLETNVWSRGITMQHNFKSPSVITNYEESICLLIDENQSGDYITAALFSEGKSENFEIFVINRQTGGINGRRLNPIPY